MKIWAVFLFLGAIFLVITPNFFGGVGLIL